MTRTKNNKVNIIAEYNLLHDIINTPKHAKNLISQYSPILHGCMNTKQGKAKLKSFALYWTVDVVP